MNKYYTKAVGIVIMVLVLAGTCKLAGYILDDSYDSEKIIAEFEASNYVEVYTISTRKVVVKIAIEIDSVDHKFCIIGYVSKVFLALDADDLALLL